MFVDMSLLVHAQGQMIDSIEMNIAQAKGFTGEAVERLKGAKKHHEKSKTLYCYALLCATGGILLVMWMLGII